MLLSFWQPSSFALSLTRRLELGIFGLFGGSLGGVFLLGVLTTRANSTGVLIGFFASVIIQYLVKMHTPIHFFVYIFTGMASCYLIGYAASLAFPSKQKSLQGLTIFTA